MAINPRQMLGLGNTRPSMQYQQLNQTYQSDPRRILGQTLMGQGTSTAPVRTPLQGLGRLSSALVGAYLQRKAGDAQVEREGEYRNTLASALSGIDMSGVPSLQALSKVNPELALPAAVTLESSLATQALKNQNKTITNKFGALNRVIELNQKPELTPSETQEFAGLSQILQQPTPITVGDGQGGTNTFLRPGIDVDAVLSGQAPAPADSAIGEGTASAVPPGTVIGSKPAKLSSAEAKFVSNLGSAQNDLKTVIDIMFNGDLQNGEYNQSSAIASGSSAGRALSGDAQRLYDAISNLVDLRLRDRTGATANESEIKNYLEAVTPGLTTRDDTQRARIARLVTELNGNIDAFSSGRNISISPIEIPELQTNNSSMTVNIPGTN